MRYLLSFALALALTASVHGQVITIDQGAGTSAAVINTFDANSEGNFGGDNIYSVPFSDMLNANNPSNTGSSGITSFLTDTTLSFSFNQTAGANDSNFGQGSVYFTPTVNLYYNFSGTFTYAGGNSFAGTAEIFNTTNNNSYVFQDVETGPPGTYNLGPGTPNSGGSFTGELVAGNTYQYLVAISANNYNGQGTQTASGVGALDLSTELSVVPEPSTWALLVASLGGLLLWQRRRNAHA